MRKATLRVLAAVLALGTIGTLGGCASGTSYGVAYRSADYYDGPYYSRHYYNRPYYERYYGPRGSFSFSYRD